MDKTDKYDMSLFYCCAKNAKKQNKANISGVGNLDGEARDERLCLTL